MKEPTWKQIESRSIEIGLHRLHRMAQGEDLFAREENFHQSCRKSFNLKYINHLRDKHSAIDKEQDRKAAAHQNAFRVVLGFIQDRVIGHNEVVQLASLRLLYIQELKRNAFPSSDYRSEKLKAGLENHDIHELIAFAKVNPTDKGCITYNLVYSDSISVTDAVNYAYKLRTKDKCEDLALPFCGIIKRAFKESKSLPWPPTPDDLEIRSSDELLPHDLVKFLNFLICGDADGETCENTSFSLCSLRKPLSNCSRTSAVL